MSKFTPMRSVLHRTICTKSIPPLHHLFVRTINAQCTLISVERLAMRLLRRYTLTATGYKFFEIGINVGPPSYVEIALGDHRRQELPLSLETWKELYEQRWNIYKLL
ncbi:hypothetical protein P5V15_011398 [Pogonomyrmex californicus]